MPRFQIWVEGFEVPAVKNRGVPGRVSAHKLGEADAASFEEACNELCGDVEFQHTHGHYDPEKRTVLGHRLLDSEAGARRAFG